MTPATLATSITTVEQLAAAGDIGRCELICGELVMMSPAGANHGLIAMEIGRRLANHVVERDLGRVFAAETGFILSRDPDTLRAPDVAFVRKSRLGRAEAQGFFQGAPDLAVEVLSPGDSADDVLAKVQDWNAGAAQVWIVDPKHRTVSIYHQGGALRSHRANETIAAGELLPGFNLPVAEIFG